MEIKYKEYDKLLPELLNKTDEYFKKIFITERKIKLEAMSSTKLPIKSTFKDWEDEIKDYNEKIRKVFSPQKLETYEDILEDFKTKIFRNSLWTVDAALKTPDPDLARYKRDYADASPDEILDTLQRILSASKKYVEEIAPSINYNTIKNENDFKMDYLNDENLLMTKIIGFGIRSEILHRSYPAHFPIMTQKSLWALYFMCDSANEFITIELRTRAGLMRVSHNWQYPYDRFTFIMNEMTKKIETLFAQYNCTFDHNLRFGYVNMFSSEIHKLHNEDRKLLHTWEEKKNNL